MGLAAVRRAKEKYKLKIRSETESSMGSEYYEATYEYNQERLLTRQDEFIEDYLTERDIYKRVPVSNTQVKRIAADLNERLLLFLCLPAVVLFCSLIYLMFDWFGYIRFVWQYMHLPRLIQNTEFYSDRPPSEGHEETIKNNHMERVSVL